MSLRAVAFCVGLGLAGVYAPAQSSPFGVTIDTTALSGVSALVAFDLIDGDTIVDNTVVISNFASDGSFDPSAALISGDVVGDLGTAAVLGDQAFFNELAQPIVLGSSITFVLDPTSNFSGIGQYDRFTLFLLDPTSFLSLYPTADPTGSDALLGFDLTGGPVVPEVHAPTADPSAVLRLTSVPEPPVLALLSIGVLLARRAVKTATVDKR